MSQAQPSTKTSLSNGHPAGWQVNVGNLGASSERRLIQLRFTRRNEEAPADPPGPPKRDLLPLSLLLANGLLAAGLAVTAAAAAAGPGIRLALSAASGTLLIDAALLWYAFRKRADKKAS